MFTKLGGLWFLAAGLAIGVVAASGSYWLRRQCQHVVPEYLQSKCRRRYASQCYCELNGYKCCKDCGRFIPFNIICGHGEDVVD